MKRVIKHTLKYINLDSYSSSPNFLGYLNWYLLNNYLFSYTT